MTGRLQRFRLPGTQTITVALLAMTLAFGLHPIELIFAIMAGGGAIVRLLGPALLAPPAASVVSCMRMTDIRKASFTAGLKTFKRSRDGYRLPQRQCPIGYT
ncbi:hypothetical protein [Methylomicrobium sp. Wu6]|uniref:hypothetical protein n=1 Tax=Methylomicrobium sp. Wu6 TaxID=3107928 RepID=UPI002DD69895|nr:hypothetical protein [Methylomicrobium sp. Wu6]MEC4749140.1 hypothetical protein [Methylomicrobium sp. Wu6]